MTVSVTTVLNKQAHTLGLVISELRRLKQEDHKVMVILDYMERSSLKKEKRSGYFQR